MAEFLYEDLKKKYEDFKNPKSIIEINGKDISQNKLNVQISDIEVEMTSGFEAAIATFQLYGCYDMEKSQFRFDEIKTCIFLGSSVLIYLGYAVNVREIFRGFIAKVGFIKQKDEQERIEITAMDVKGIMMSGNYSKQLKADTFSDAVKEILEKTAYSKLRSIEVIKALTIADTPDKKQAGGGSGKKASDKTIEMVCESDYEFVVKAAKKFNYEFFTVGGTVYFRKAKEYTSPLMEIQPGDGITSYEIQYDITGLVEEIEVRGMDVGKAKMISTKKKLKNKLSNGNKAKPLLSKSQKVYIDATISSQTEAEYRASYLAEEISYRLGTLEADFIGLPELTPGRFIRLAGMGTAVSNTFYLVSVRHIMSNEEGYITKVIGKAASMATS